MKISIVSLSTLLLFMGLFIVQNNGAIASSWIESQTAELQLLDKITARISTKSVLVGGGTEFGTLKLRVHYCAYRPPEEPPESTAFLEIYEAKPGEDRRSLFYGWMFASSPGLNGLEHPVYDVWVLDCKLKSPPKSVGAG